MGRPARRVRRTPGLGGEPGALSVQQFTDMNANEFERFGNYVPTVLPRRYDAFLFLDQTHALRPLHAETGFWRMGAGETVELVVAHPNGHAEVAEGRLSGTTISTASTAIVQTSTAKPVDSIERDIDVRGEVMTYDLRMAAMGKPLEGHLQAELRRGATR